MTNVYDIGDEIILTGTFTINGVLTNPTTATWRLKAPDGTTTTPAVTNPSTGVYKTTVTPTLVGRYTYRLEGTGAATAAEEAFFTVRRSAF